MEGLEGGKLQPNDLQNWLCQQAAKVLTPGQWHRGEWKSTGIRRKTKLQTSIVCSNQNLLLVTEWNSRTHKQNKRILFSRHDLGNVMWLWLLPSGPDNITAHDSNQPSQSRLPDKALAHLWLINLLDKCNFSVRHQLQNFTIYIKQQDIKMNNWIESLTF